MNNNKTFDPSKTLPLAPSYDYLEVAFIDCDLEDRDTLVRGLRAGVRLVDLKKSEDGLDQILNYLRVNRGVRVIHLISHGSAGKLELGKIALTNQNILCYKNILAQIGSLLAANAELHIYGCELASNDDGLTFVKQLAVLTGCSVAASKTLTGAKSLGGDWILEVELGQVTAPMAFEAAIVDQYNAVLVAPTDENFDTVGQFDTNNNEQSTTTVNGWLFSTLNNSSVPTIARVIVTDIGYFPMYLNTDGSGSDKV